jgi:hypothetical protein
MRGVVVGVSGAARAESAGADEQGNETALAVDRWTRAIAGNGWCWRWAMKEQMRGNGKQEQGLALVPKPVRRTEAGQGVREATTGRVVSVVAGAAGLPDEMQEVVARPKMVLLPRVWAVAETGEVQEVVRGPVPEAAAKLPPRMETEVGDGLAFYRKYTEATLRRFVRLSMEVGRAPSLLGRELFRGKVSSYKMTTFEDVVIFCFDMERMLARLRPMDQKLIKRIAMQEYTQGEAASMLGMSLRRCCQSYGEAVDRLTGMLMEARMLEPLKSCQ